MRQVLAKRHAKRIRVDRSAVGVLPPVRRTNSTHPCVCGALNPKPMATAAPDRRWRRWDGEHRSERAASPSASESQDWRSWGTTRRPRASCTRAWPMPLDRQVPGRSILQPLALTETNGIDLVLFGVHSKTLNGPSSQWCAGCMHVAACSSLKPGSGPRQSQVTAVHENVKGGGEGQENCHSRIPSMGNTQAERKEMAPKRAREAWHC
jgi:hypothetical protein